MTTYLTTEQTKELALSVGLDWQAIYVNDYEREDRYHALCNAAIAAYLADAPSLNSYVDSCIKDHMRKYFESLAEGLPEPAIKEAKFGGYDAYTLEQLLDVAAKREAKVEIDLPEPIGVIQQHTSGRERVILKGYVTDCDAAWGAKTTDIFTRDQILTCIAKAKGETCTSDEWLANCPQSVRDLANKIKEETK